MRSIVAMRILTLRELRMTDGLDSECYEFHGYANAYGYLCDNRIRDIDGFLSSNLPSRKTE